MPAHDTSEAAAAVQTAVQRRLGPQRRFALALAMSEGARELARAGIRLRQPDLTEAEVSETLLRQLYGKPGGKTAGGP